jgi:hypothetical protein
MEERKTEKERKQENMRWEKKDEKREKLLKSKLTHSWSRALLEKPPIVQLLENFPAFYGTRRFITAFT